MSPGSPPLGRLVRAANRTPVILAQKLGSGGEGDIYALQSDPTLVAKIYHRFGPEHLVKLSVMITHPPADPMAERGHVSIAWPVDLLLDGRGNPVGYLMPRAPHDRKLFTYYNMGLRLKTSPLFHYQYLLTTAANIASAAASLHDAGYVIGDVNESNILAGDNALVTLVDTDSFQVRDAKSGRIFRSPVGKPEYTPPELQGKAFEQVNRGPEHDAFGLGVLFFQLLLEGLHPFDGVYSRAGEPPERQECIAQGYFPHGRKAPAFFTPKPTALSLDTLAPDTRALFLLCFSEGHKNPALRPSAREWREALNQATKALTQCRQNTQHWYVTHLGTDCPWCARTVRLRGLDPFPARATVQAGRHLTASVRIPPPAPPPAARPAPTPVSPIARPVPKPPVSPHPGWAFVGSVAGHGARWLKQRLRGPYGWAFVATAVLLAAGLAWFVLGRGQQPAEAKAVPPVPAGSELDRPTVAAISIRTHVNPADGLTYVFVPPGKFVMGCSPGDTECDDDEKPPHAEQITGGFWLSQTEVTQAAWKKMMKGEDPSNFKGDQLPVETVDWNQSSAYCKAVGGRLPTAKEWEYAARGGTTGARYGELNAVSWNTTNSGSTTHPVGQKLANAYGLYDMLGNVWEWTSDDYTSKMKELRGGSWFNSSVSVRVSFRTRYVPAIQLDNYGLRCVGELP